MGHTHPHPSSVCGYFFGMLPILFGRYIHPGPGPQHWQHHATVAAEPAGPFVRANHLRSPGKKKCIECGHRRVCISKNRERVVERERERERECVCVLVGRGPSTPKAGWFSLHFMGQNLNAAASQASGSGAQGDLGRMARLWWLAMFDLSILFEECSGQVFPDELTILNHIKPY